MGFKILCGIINELDKELENVDIDLFVMRMSAMYTLRAKKLENELNKVSRILSREN